MSDTLVCFDFALGLLKHGLAQTLGLDSDVRMSMVPSSSPPTRIGNNNYKELHLLWKGVTVHCAKLKCLCGCTFWRGRKFCNVCAGAHLCATTLRHQTMEHPNKKRTLKAQKNSKPKRSKVDREAQKLLAHQYIQFGLESTEAVANYALEEGWDVAQLAENIAERVTKYWALHPSSSVTVQQLSARKKAMLDKFADLTMPEAAGLLKQRLSAAFEGLSARNGKTRADYQLAKDSVEEWWDDELEKLDLHKAYQNKLNTWKASTLGNKWKLISGKRAATDKRYQYKVQQHS